MALGGGHPPELAFRKAGEAGFESRVEQRVANGDGEKGADLRLLLLLFFRLLLVGLGEEPSLRAGFAAERRVSRADRAGPAEILEAERALLDEHPLGHLLTLIAEDVWRIVVVLLAPAHGGMIGPGEGWWRRAESPGRCRLVIRHCRATLLEEDSENTPYEESPMEHPIRTSFMALALPLGALVSAGRATGQLLPPGPSFTVFVPAAASIRGLNGTFFRTDLLLFNQAYTPRTVSLSYACFAGACQPDPHRTIFTVLQPRETRILEDAAGSTFAFPDSAGGIKISWDQASTESLLPSVLVSSRTTTRDAASGGTYGFLVPSGTLSNRTVFFGLAGGGGSSAFRSNVGLFNVNYSTFDPSQNVATVTLTLRDALGAVLGTPLTVSLGQGTQINDVFKAVGASSVVTTNASLIVDQTGGVIPYVTVIDNATGDSSYLPGSDDSTSHSFPHSSLRVFGTLFATNPTLRTVPGITVSVVQDGTSFFTHSRSDGFFEIFGLAPLKAVHFVVDPGLGCPTVSLMLWLSAEDLQLNPIICP
ncbi:MAG: hypothetical protein NEA02_01755 [Thermoanaerobaculia bacterium]|nr:hypothetical protein [Thermoanaerobaculia bacterium]